MSLFFQAFTPFKRQFLGRLISLLFIVLLIQTTLIYLIYRFYAINENKNELLNLTQRISDGIKHENGQWDTSSYIADPQTPHPSGSSGFNDPLYIISTEGLVIERNAPLTNLLDTSDFNHLLDFQTPQVLETITQEQWAILSQPITYGDKILGIAVVALYNPENILPSFTNQKLIDNLNKLQTQLHIENGNISSKNIDIRTIDYDISFEVVTNYNKVLLNNGRMPTFIDKSYVFQELQHDEHFRNYTDPSDHRKYLLITQQLTDTNNTPIGIIVAGKSISFIDKILFKTFPWILLNSIVVTILLTIFYKKLTDQLLLKIVSIYEEQKKLKPLTQHIYFNPQSSQLHINDQTLPIPHDSNQYYILKALFSKPNKRWENDELLDAIGHSPLRNNWRKIYDTIITINKKVEPHLNIRLIEHQDKTYQITPKLVQLLKKPSP